MNYFVNFETERKDKENTFSAQNIINMIYRRQFKIISAESPNLNAWQTLSNR